jgi:hypothetical protein
MLAGRDSSFYTPEGTDAQRYWLRHDGAGRPLDQQGKVTSECAQTKAASFRLTRFRFREPIGLLIGASLLPKMFDVLSILLDFWPL